MRIFIIITNFIICLNIFISVVNGYSAKKIYGGQIVGIYKHPYQVSIQMQNEHICGGTIISSQHILTGANCVLSDLNVFYGNLQVLVGTNDLNYHESHSLWQIYQVAYVIYHEKYNPHENWINDIAILKVETPIIFIDKLIEKVRMPIRFNNNGRHVIVGWGSNPVTNVIIRYLQRLDVKSITSNSCRNKYFNNIFKTQFCILPISPNTVITSGNSGSPVLISKTIVGIVSIVIINIHKPVIYTHVYDYIDWIEQMKIKV